MCEQTRMHKAEEKKERKKEKEEEEEEEKRRQREQGGKSVKGSSHSVLFSSNLEVFFLLQRTIIKRKLHVQKTLLRNPLAGGTEVDALARVIAVSSDTSISFFTLACVPFLRRRRRIVEKFG